VCRIVSRAFYAQAEFWESGNGDLSIYPSEPPQAHSVFGDGIKPQTEDDVPAASEERLARAGWRVTGEWTHDGRKWRAPVAGRRST
jgi:hypothetical protein